LNTREAALSYWRQDLRVIPLEPRSKKPHDNEWGRISYATEEAVLRAFGPDDNIGLVLVDGIVDVDVDSERVAGFATAWMQPTRWVASRNTTQSVHFFYRVEDEVVEPKVFNYPGTRKPIVEIRTGQGKQTMLPPSLHPEGEEVAWLNSLGGSRGGLPQVPGSALVRRVASFAAAAALAKSWPVEGSRHEATKAMVGGLVRAGWSEEDLSEFVRLVCAMAGETEKEIREDRLYCVGSTLSTHSTGAHITGWRRLGQILVDGPEVVDVICKWLGTAEPLSAAEKFALTEDGNSEKLVAEAGGNLRYCPALGWLEWDGGGTGRWIERSELIVVGRAAEIARQIGDEVNSPGVLPEARKAMEAHVRRSLSQRSKEAVARGARSVRGVLVDVDELDSDPWLFSCANGVVDLRTGELLTPQRDWYVTLGSRVSYPPVPEAAAASSSEGADAWSRFLFESCAGDGELMRWLQRAAGYSMTGVTWEENFFFIHGKAATGKSTFMAAMGTVLGSYAATVDAETFMKSHGGGGGGGSARPDLARLVGKRFVATIEVDRGKELAEGLVKQLTGGDRVTVRNLYKSAFEFEPSFKMWISANHAPYMSGDDSAIWRRVLVVPFENVVPPERRDSRLKAALKDPSSPISVAALSWAVEGARLWKLEGLGVVPRAVLEATEEQRENADTLGQWLQERLELTGARSDRIQFTPLLQSYNDWLKERGHRPVSDKTFRERVGDRLGRMKVDGRVWYWGVRLRPYGLVGNVVHFVPGTGTDA
jgi:putative DNA primase/helicase